MEPLVSVYSGFKVSLKRNSVLKNMGVEKDDPNYAALCEMFDRVNEADYIKPDVAYAVRDNDIFGLKEEIGDSRYVVLCFCTVGNAISDAAAKKQAEGNELEAALLNAIGDYSLKRVKAMSVGYIKGSLTKLLLGISTEPFVPGKNLSNVFNSIVLVETHAERLYGATVDLNKEEIVPKKSVVCVYGCDTARQLPFSAFTPPDCALCLRRDCENCDVDAPEALSAAV